MAGSFSSPLNPHVNDIVATGTFPMRVMAHAPEPLPVHVFDFDASDFSADYAQQGYALIRHCVTPEFLELALKFLRSQRSRDADLTDWQFKGKKRQYLLDIDNIGSLLDGVRDHVAGLTGLDRELLTLCERHIKDYSAEADPNPPAHKDRLASEVAVGIPLCVEPNSRVVIYPDVDAGTNPFQSTAKWRDALEEDQLPEALTAGVEPVRLNCQPGDAVFFRGSALLHEREHGANSTVIYLKFNAMGMDPIGEDPRTAAREVASLQIAESLASGKREVATVCVSLGPKFEQVEKVYSRSNWQEILLANLWGENGFRIDEVDFQVLRECMPRVRLQRLLTVADDECTTVARVVRLARKGAVLLSLRGG